MEYKVGTILGNYHIDKELGEGGFAEVYLATHIYLQTQNALKVLKFHLTSNGQKEFLEEAKRLAELGHPDIVSLVYYFLAASNPHNQQLLDVPIIVMEYMNDGSLEDFMEKRNWHPLSLTESLVYLKPIARALRFAHEQKPRGVIHQDVKPANCLISLDSQGNRRVKLADFGIAVDARHTSTRKHINPAGTVTYMSPEQIQGLPVTASDQYALAIMTYFLLSGNPPFLGSAQQVIKGHLYVDPNPLDYSALGLTQITSNALLKALAKDARDRFGNTEAFVNALEKSLTAQPYIIQPVSPRQPAVLPQSLPMSMSFAAPAVPSWIANIPAAGQHRYLPLLESPEPFWPMFFQGLRNYNGRNLMLEALEKHNYNDVGNYALAYRHLATPEEMRQPNLLKGISEFELALLRAVAPDLFFVGNDLKHNAIVKGIITTTGQWSDAFGKNDDEFIRRWHSFNYVSKEFVDFLERLQKVARRTPFPIAPERKRYYDLVAHNTRTRIGFFDSLHPLLRDGFRAKNWEPVYYYAVDARLFDFIPVYSFTGTERVPLVDFVIYRCANSLAFGLEAFYNMLNFLYPTDQTLINVICPCVNQLRDREIEEYLRSYYLDIPDFVDEVLARLLYSGKP